MLFDQAEDLFHFPLVIDILREYVFVERIARRAVNEQIPVLASIARQLAQKIPAPGVFGRSAPPRFQLVPGPEDGPFGAGIEPFGVEQRTLIVIA